MQVPARYIKNKEVDFDGEIFACMNLPFCIAGLEIRPPAIGVFSLLEVIDSLFIKDFAKSDAMDFCRALYIAHCRKAAAEDVRGWIKQGGRENFRVKDPNVWIDWDRKVAKFADEINISSLSPADIAAFKNFLTENTFNGYDMIPDSGQSEWMPYLFGAETIASLMLTCGAAGIDEVIWEIPLCLVGHMAACTAKRNGIKGVARPQDETDMKLQFKLAYERESKGELHPWQIAEPENPNFELSEAQIKARPEIKAEHIALLEAKLANKRASNV
jgi:hypothetical protein